MVVRMDRVMGVPHHSAHRDFGGLGDRLVETQHDDLQAVTPICSLEKAGLNEVARPAGRMINAAVSKAIAVRETQGEAVWGAYPAFEPPA